MADTVTKETWPGALYDLLRANGVTQFCYVPDAGHKVLIDRSLADAVGRGDLEGFARAARGSAGYLPLAQGAIDYALAGVTSLAEAMAVGGGLEELTDFDAAVPLDDSIVATLLEQRA